jgi:excisionase family DNA binding protein
LSRPKPLERDWVGLSEASGLLGVSPATLRRWSDAGRLRVFTTPGGHRRFSRAALQRLLPADRSRRPSLGTAGLTPIRIARSYRRASREVSTELPWVLALTDEQRVLFRERGHILAAGLLQYLDAGQPESARHHLKEASVSAAEYGRVAAELGLSLSQTVEGFLRFRAPFFHELVVAARRRGFDTGETTDLMELAERGMDQLLVATMTGHSVRLVQGRGRQARAVPPFIELADKRAR